MDFLIGLFTSFVDPETPGQYHLSAAFSNQVLNPGGDSDHSPSESPVNFDGLMYPSVAYLWNGHCLALHERTFPALQVERVFEFLVVENEKSFPFSWLALRKIGQVEGASIRWRPGSEDGRMLLDTFGPKLPKEKNKYIEAIEHNKKVLLVRKTPPKQSD